MTLREGELLLIGALMGILSFVGGTLGYAIGAHNALAESYTPPSKREIAAQVRADKERARAEMCYFARLDQLLAQSKGLAVSTATPQACRPIIKV